MLFAAFLFRLGFPDFPVEIDFDFITSLLFIKNVYLSGILKHCFRLLQFRTMNTQQFIRVVVLCLILLFFRKKNSIYSRRTLFGFTDLIYSRNISATVFVLFFAFNIFHNLPNSFRTSTSSKYKPTSACCR